MGMKYIYICGSCGAAFSDESGRENRCDKCNKLLIETKIPKVDWAQYTPEQKADAKSQVIEYAKSGNVKSQDDFDYDEKGNANNASLVATGSDSLTLKELLSLTKVMQHDIHFMYIVLVIYLILTGIGILIIFANLL